MTIGFGRWGSVNARKSWCWVNMAAWWGIAGRLAALRTATSLCAAAPALLGATALISPHARQLAALPLLKPSHTEK